MYLVEEDFVYCFYCLIFGEVEGLFRIVGFNDWKNVVVEKRDIFKIYEKSKIYFLVKERVENFIFIFLKRKLEVYISISKVYEDRVNCNC